MINTKRMELVLNTCSLRLEINSVNDFQSCQISNIVIDMFIKHYLFHFNGKVGEYSLVKFFEHNMGYIVPKEAKGLCSTKDFSGLIIYKIKCKNQTL